MPEHILYDEEKIIKKKKAILEEEENEDEQYASKKAKKLPKYAEEKKELSENGVALWTMEMPNLLLDQDEEMDVRKVP